MDRCHECKSRNHLLGVAVCPEHESAVLTEVFVVPVVERNSHLAVASKHDLCNSRSGRHVVFGDSTHDSGTRWQFGDACQLSNELFEDGPVD